MIRISKDPSKDLTVFTATGEIVAYEMIEVIEKLYSTEPTRYVIWDLTEALGSFFKSEDIDRVIEAPPSIPVKELGERPY